MGEVIEQGFDPKAYWIGGQCIDLTAQRFSSEQLAEIRYQVQIDAIPKMLYTKEQWHEIEAGIAEKVDVMAYANPAYSPEQMSILHGALNAEAQGYLTHADVLAVADPSKTVEAMRTELHALRKDPDTEQRTVAARKTSETAHGTKAPKRQNGKKKSVLEDLREKQAKIAGAEPHKSPGKRKTKEME